MTLHRRAARVGAGCCSLPLIAALWTIFAFVPQATQHSTENVVVAEDYDLFRFAAHLSGLAGGGGHATKKRTRGLRIIASGLSRTGTLTLKHSLASLGYTCYHAEDLMLHGHAGLWLAAAPDNTVGQQALRAVADSVLDLGYDCVVDATWPWSARLLQIFPDAKVIHTVRDSPEAWWRSYEKLAQTFLPIVFSRPYRWLISVDFLRTAVREMFGVSSWGYENLDVAHPLPWVDYISMKPAIVQKFKDQWMAAYQMQQDLMTAVAPPGQLLVFNVKQGWGPLCSFLQVGEPCLEGALPHLNKGCSFDLIRKILLVVCFAYPMLLLLPPMLALVIFKVLRAAGLLWPASARVKEH